MQYEKKRMARDRDGRITLPIVIMAGGALMVLAVAAMYGWNWYSGRGDGGAAVTANGSASNAAGTSLPSGPVQVAGVEVLQPVADAGQVALNTPVQRLWRLRNTSTTRITVSPPTIEVLEGC